MFKKLLTFLVTMSLLTAFAAVDVNKGTAQELDGIKGIGPVTTRLILAERKKGEFKSWADFIGRVKGVGDATAAKMSANGLTVGGAPYTGAGATPAPAAASKAEKTAPASAKNTVKDGATGTKEATKESAKDATKVAKPSAAPASATPATPATPAKPATPASAAKPATPATPAAPASAAKK